MCYVLETHRAYVVLPAGTIGGFDVAKCNVRTPLIIGDSADQLNAITKGIIGKALQAAINLVTFAHFVTSVTQSGE